MQRFIKWVRQNNNVFIGAEIKIFLFSYFLNLQLSEKGVISDTFEDENLGAIASEIVWMVHST